MQTSTQNFILNFNLNTTCKNSKKKKSNFLNRYNFKMKSLKKKKKRKEKKKKQNKNDTYLIFSKAGT